MFKLERSEMNCPWQSVADSCDRNSVWLPILLLTILTTAVAAESDSIIDPEALKPRGEYYDAEVPDTLDLAERACLSVSGLTRFLNPAQNFAPYGQGFFNVNPPFMSQTEIGRGEPSWGKIAESLIKARLMCGSDEGLDIEAKMLRGMLKEKRIVEVAADGPTPTSRALYALIALYRINPSPELRRQIDLWVKAHVDLAKKSGDGAYYYDGPPDPSYGYLWQAFVQGTAIRVLSEWHCVSGDESALRLAQQLANHLMRPQYWAPETEPRAMAGAEHGHFAGHHHSYVQALMGILWCGDAGGNQALKQFARDGYEYMRCFGLANIGVYGEMCTTGDMTQLAIKLCDTGMGDYWEDVDRYARNHLTELQITDATKLKSVAVELAAHSRQLDPVEETRDDVIERNVGAFLSDSTHPTLIPAPHDPNARGPLMWTICCTGNCTPALYYVWEAIVRCRDGSAQINLLLNRASPWLDIDSYLPYEGKVVIRNKTARRIAVRLPRWADKEAVKSEIQGMQGGLDKRDAPFFVDHYLVFDQVHPGDTIIIRFPMVMYSEKVTLKWPPDGFWTESTRIPPEMAAATTEFSLVFRGNTLVDIQPRDQRFGYPLYQREHLRSATAAPIHKVRRFVAERYLTNAFCAASSPDRSALP